MFQEKSPLWVFMSTNTAAFKGGGEKRRWMKCCRIWRSRILFLLRAERSATLRRKLARSLLTMMQLSSPVWNVCWRHEAVRRWSNGTLTGVWATFSHFWWTGERLEGFLLSIQRESLRSARQHPTWNNWLAVWFRFEGQTFLLSMSATTYLRGQIFSIKSINTTKLRWRLTYGHLNHILKLAVTQNVTPDIDALMEAKRCQISGVK